MSQTTPSRPSAPADVAMGDKGTCLQCGHEIEYIGPYWRHVGISPRHIAMPALASIPATPAGGTEAMIPEPTALDCELWSNLPKDYADFMREQREGAVYDHASMTCITSLIRLLSRERRRSERLIEAAFEARKALAELVINGTLSTHQWAKAQGCLARVLDMAKADRAEVT